MILVDAAEFCVKLSESVKHMSFSLALFLAKSLAFVLYPASTSHLVQPRNKTKQPSQSNNTFTEANKC